MVYSLIDIENQCNGFSKRKEIMNSLKSCIQSTFYKNETDAKRYYLDKVERKKEYGGKYNEKILDNSYDYLDEDEENEE